MKIDGNIVNSSPFLYYQDAANFLSSGGYANTSNFSLSQVLDVNYIKQSFKDEFNDKVYPLSISVPYLKNQYILINADDVPIRNINTFNFKLHRTTGIIKVTPDGKHYQILWGFALGAKPSKYLEQHLACHNEILKRNPGIYTSSIANVSSPYWQQFSYLDKDNDENKYTFMLWDSLTDLARLTPQGIGIIPTMTSPSKQCTEAFRKKFEKYNVVIRDKQNIMISGSGWDEVLSIAQQMERASYNALTIGQTSVDKQYVSREYWDGVQKEFKVTLNPDVLQYAPKAVDTADKQKDENND